CKCRAQESTRRTTLLRIGEFEQRLDLTEHRLRLRIQANQLAIDFRSRARERLELTGWPSFNSLASPTLISIIALAGLLSQPERNTCAVFRICRGIGFSVTSAICRSKSRLVSSENQTPLPSLNNLTVWFSGETLSAGL